MHDCPNCGQTCDCHDGIDGCYDETEEDVFEHCTCCEDDVDEDLNEFYDEE